MNCKQVADTIFKFNPDPFYTHKLILKSTADGKQCQDEHVFEALQEIFILGVKKLFADNRGFVDLLEMRAHDFELVRECLQSIGFDLFIRATKQTPNHQLALPWNAPKTLVLFRRKDDTEPLMVQFLPFIQDNERSNSTSPSNVPDPIIE